MAQTPKKGAPEPWLKPPQKRGPEPWLKPPKKGVPSHGSNLKKRGSRAMALKIFRAMAQTPKKWGPEPWLKLNFVLHILTSKISSFFEGFPKG